jgi:hypothetical protein
VAGGGDGWRWREELGGVAQREWVVKMSTGVVVPFIGPERWGGGRPGSDGGGGALSKWWPVMEGEARGMAPSDEGKWRR